MKIINLALQGVKRKSSIDLVTILQYHPGVMAAYLLLRAKLELPIDHDDFRTIPEDIISGYRDHAYDPAVKNSPHNFAIALDICVSNLNAKIAANRPAVLDEQIRWARAAQGVFTGFGFYPFQNTIHCDLRTPDWMQEYGGTPYWVKNPYAAKQYKGFYVLDEAIDYAKIVSQQKI